MSDWTIMYIAKRDKSEVYECILDKEDYEKVKNFSWHLKWEKGINGYYVKTTEYLGVIEGKLQYKTIYLHRFLMGEHKGHIDHLNHNTLDNRKSNLEPKSASKNHINRLGANKNTTTGVRNVSYDRRNNQFLVQLQVNGKNTCFGRFKDLEKAKTLAEQLREEIYFAD
jgi:hypothetical protein